MFGCTEHHSWLNINRFSSSRGKDWTYIIFGRTGPTGKTYLCNKLREHGYNAIELTEEIYPFVDYLDQKNHYIVYEHSKCVVIILNKKLPKHIYPGIRKV